MISENTREYLDTWNKKIEGIDGNRLKQAFDKFESLLKIYGRLANDISAKLVSNKTLSKTGGDQKIATQNIIIAVTCDCLGREFEKSNYDDIEALYNIMPRFNICFTKEAVARPNIDIELREALKSGDVRIKTLSILQIIYFVRCNNVHSRKAHTGNQILLLEPLNNLLQTLNKLLYDNLDK